MSDEGADYVLKGTTLRVYRCLYRAGTPMGIHDVQRALKLSSPSVAEYHIKKLVRAGLAKEGQNGYTVDKVVFENVIRIRRTVIPLQTTFVAFFVMWLGSLIGFFVRARDMVETGVQKDMAWYEYLYPNTYDTLLLAPETTKVLTALGVLIGFIVLANAAGAALFQRRDI